MQEKRETHQRMLKALLPLAATVVLLMTGLWMRWPTVEYDGPATQDAYNQFAFDQFAYSDIASLYFRDGLQNYPRPYLDYQFEYPVGLGFLVYLLNVATGTMPQYFLLTSLVMAVSAFWIVALIPSFPRGRVWLFALAPALALYVNVNWDMWGVLLMVVALLLFVHERDGLGAAVLAAAVWTKFFPIVFLPFLILDQFRQRGRRAIVRTVAVFAITSAAINIPVLLLAPTGWWYFFQFNADRDREMNLWTFFDPSWLSTAEINHVSALLLLWGLGVLFLLQRRSPSGAWLPAGCAMLAWFFFVSKVYSPQYSLWIVVLLAVMGASLAPAVAWSAVDLLYFAGHFVWLGLIQYGDAQSWFVKHGLEPATVLREVMLLIVVGWCVKQMSAPTPDRSERPQGSPASVT